MYYHIHYNLIGKKLLLWPKVLWLELRSLGKWKRLIFVPQYTRLPHSEKSMMGWFKPLLLLTCPWYHGKWLILYLVPQYTRLWAKHDGMTFIFATPHLFLVPGEVVNRIPSPTNTPGWLILRKAWWDDIYIFAITHLALIPWEVVDLIPGPTIHQFGLFWAKPDGMTFIFATPHLFLVPGEVVNRIPGPTIHQVGSFWEKHDGMT